MSYILDALKKLESEKDKKSRADGMVNISGALLRDKPHHISGRNYWKIAVVVVFASLVAFGAAWFLLKSGKGAGSLKFSLTAKQPPVVKSAPLPPPQPPVLPPPVAPPPLPTAAPVVQAVKPPPAIVPDASGVTKPPAEIPVQRHVKHGNERKGRAARTVTAEKTVTPLAAAPADIKVSGIAWQDERRARRAVVNGFLMQEGAVVSGARISEIFQDRVRFTQDNRVFEIPITLSGK